MLRAATFNYASHHVCGFCRLQSEGRSLDPAPRFSAEALHEANAATWLHEMFVLLSPDLKKILIEGVMWVSKPDGIKARIYLDGRTAACAVHFSSIQICRMNHT